MIRTFEKYINELEVSNAGKFVVTFTNLVQNYQVLCKSYTWVNVSTVTINNVKLYSYADAKIEADSLQSNYPFYTFNIIPIEELELKFNANKYNL